MAINKPQKSLEFTNSDKINRNVRETELRLTAAVPEEDTGYYFYPSHAFPNFSSPAGAGEVLMNNKEACSIM